MNLALQTKLLACKSLPTLPVVALRVLELCRAEELDLSLIAQAIGQDPALAAKLLRTANSGALGARGKVTTLARAVALLGTNATLSIALSFTLVRASVGRRDPFDHRAFWRRAVLSGVAGQVLGAPGFVEPEEVFLACLLQDVGILGLHEALAAEYGALYQRARGDHDWLVDAERQALGTDHAEASCLLMRHWRLPEMYEQAALFSHDLERADGSHPHLRRLLECVVLSGPLADAWNGNLDPARTRAALVEARERAGATVETVTAALRNMAPAVAETAAELELDLGLADPARLEAILDEACGLRAARAAPSAAAVPVEPWTVPGPASSGEGIGDHALADRPVEAAFELARATGQPLTIALCSVEGEAAHDAPELALLLLKCLRTTDFVAACGEAVAAVLPGTGARGGLVVAQRMRRCAAAAERSLSVGVATLQAGSDYERVSDLLAAAQRALAAARSAGSGCVALQGPGPGEPIVQVSAPAPEQTAGLRRSPC